MKNLNAETTFVAHCNENLERIDLKDIDSRENITFLIGPEGDFFSEEITLVKQNGFSEISLGENRLRTETAGVYVCNVFALI